MRNTTLRFPPRARLLCCVLWIAAGDAGWGGDSTSKAGDPSGEKKAKPEFKGPVGCAGCHSDPSKLYVEKGVTKFISLTEFTQWNDKDKHARAFKNFFQDYDKKGPDGERPPLSPRVAQMTKLLNWGDLTNDERCLSCHANVQKDKPRLDDFNISQGVSCESCHGPSSLWLAPHQESAWRTTSVADKEKEGMVDVRNPIARANQCVSCHVGDPQQGKVLTHEMYAAGHPPLPSIEVETFAEHMPPHWRYMDEKPDLPQRQQILSALGYHSGDDLHRTKSVMVGSVLSLRAAVSLAGNRAQTEAPDFAQFDCAACHHDLRTPSWRQNRHAGKPGRPQPPEWPTVLIKLGLAQLAGPDENERKKQEAEFERRLQALRDAFDQTPFGNPKSVKQASDDLVEWLDELAARLDKSTYNKTAASKALRSLWELSQSKDPYDYESARQLAWAFLTIFKELAHEPTSPKAGSPRVKAVRQQLGDVVQIDLPWTQQASIEKQLTASQLAQGSYDPAKFRQSFANLRDLLKRPEPQR